MSQTAQYADGWIPPTCLNSAQVSHIDLSLMGKLLLRQFSLDANLPHVCADDPVPIHPTGSRPEGL